MGARHVVRLCSAAGCSKQAVTTGAFGAGDRCEQHQTLSVQKCQVPGCDRQAWGKNGFREYCCKKHWGKRCTEPGCGKRVYNARKDENPRCHLHGGQQCAAAGCTRRPHVVVGMEKLC